MPVLDIGPFSPVQGKAQIIGRPRPTRYCADRSRASTNWASMGGAGPASPEPAFNWFGSAIGSSLSTKSAFDPRGRGEPLDELRQFPCHASRSVSFLLVAAELINTSAEAGVV